MQAEAEAETEAEAKAWGVGGGSEMEGWSVGEVGVFLEAMRAKLGAKVDTYKTTFAGR